MSFPEFPAHGAPRRACATGAGGAPSTNAIESASGQLHKGGQEPRSLLSSDEAALELLWPTDPQQRRTRPRTRQGPGQTRQQTHRPPRLIQGHPTINRKASPSTSSPRPTRPDHPPPLTHTHRKTDRLTTDPQALEPPAHSARVKAHPVAPPEFEADTGGGPLVGAPHALDLFHPSLLQGGRATVGTLGLVLQARFAPALAACISYTSDAAAV